MSAAVTHTGTKSAEKLEYGVLQITLVCHTSLYTFGYKLLGILLEVTVLAAVLHSSDGSHAAIYLVFSALEQLVASGALFTACKHAAHHADITACCDGLGDLSGVLDTAVSDNGNTVLLRNTIAIHNRRDLRYTDTCNHTGRTDGTGSDTDLYRVSPCLDQCLGSGCGCHIAGNHLQIRVSFLDHLQTGQNVLGMTMGTVQNHYVNLRCNQCGNSLQYICRDTYRSAAEETSLGILGSQRILDRLLDILDGDQTLEVKVLVNDGKLLLTRLGKDPLCLLQSGSLGSGDQALAGHGFLDLLREISLKLQVAIGDDTNQLSSLSDRHTGNTELAHQCISVCQRMLGRQ